MKKIILLSGIALAVISFASCKKCTTCTESQTQVTSHYCGPTASVNKFEDDLKSEGAAVGQTWTCVAEK
jgi:hypothetical protein